jgi:polar amino acid transport system permease protein
VQQHWFAVTVGALAALLVGALAYVVGSSQDVRWQEVARYFPSHEIIDGVWVTLMLTVLAMVFGFVLAVVLATMRLSKSGVLRAISSAYIWFFRGTPLLVQLIFWYNIALFIPQVTVGSLHVATNSLVTPLGAALLGLTLNVAAYLAEIVRAGILAIDRGQTEASLALGLTRRQALFRIVMPQAARVIVPPLANNTIDMLKATSLVSVIGTGDLLTRAQDIYSENFYVIELLMVACCWYLIMTTAATFLQNWVEKRLSRSLKLVASER